MLRGSSPMLGAIWLALRYMWAFPYVLLGLLGALLFWALGWIEKQIPYVGTLSLVYVCRGPLQRALLKRGWGAFTFGGTVFVWTPTPSEELIAHECHGHVGKQTLVYGVLAPLLYLAILPFTGYRDHPFERQAREVAAAWMAAKGPGA